MKYFMEVYVWLVLAILMLIACVQHIVAGNTYTAFGLLFVGVIFLYVFIKEKSRFN
jgi:drug/metabolite transporter superfamily protein YnfA